nr:MAG TPA: hypothetical protein [Caudoviricetes sp.]
MGVPRSSKETGIIDFCPRSIYPLKWVCGSEWVCGFVKIDDKWVCGSEWVCGFYGSGLSVLTNLSFLK